MNQILGSGKTPQICDAIELPLASLCEWKHLNECKRHNLQILQHVASFSLLP